MTRRALSLTVLLIFAALLGPIIARAQFASPTGSYAGTAGQSCAGLGQQFAWPDANGHMLQCVSNVWAAVVGTGTAGAGGSSGDVQYNGSGTLAGSNNLYWNNSSGYLGVDIGSSAANALDVNGAMAVGSFAGSTAPSNGLVVSGQVGIGTSTPAANLDLNGGLSIGADFGTTLTTLNGAINASVTTITVASTANYPSAGAISIGGSTEVIQYTGKTGTTFTGCTRGAYGTTAASHSSGATVYGMLLQVQPGSQGGLYSSALTVFNDYAMIIGTPALPYSSGWPALGVGTNITLSAGALAVGNNAAATNTQSVAIGTSVTASGAFSIAFGSNTTSAAWAEEVVGQYNKATGSENGSTWQGNATNPIFVIGIGTAGASANALMVFQNGQMLVDGGTTVAIPAGAASLTAMGVSGTSNDAALNATNSSGASLLYVRDDGNVGIGTTSPAALLHVGSPSASGAVAELQSSSGACTLAPSSSTLTESCSSDVRLKTDIVDAGDALVWLDDMRVRDFTIKSTGERRTGVIAQEMLPAHADMVHMGPEGFYAVEEPNPWKLIKAIQQLKAEDDDLKSANDDFETAGEERRTEIKALRARLDALEAGQ
jgi:hypothetical protein